MNNKQIIIIDDDDDELKFVTNALAELKIKNEIIVFNDGFRFLDYISVTKKATFFILCDINLAKINGLELKRMIFEDELLRVKCVPFIFMSTSGVSNNVMKAYSYGVQGYFLKSHTLKGMKDLLQSIINYWTHSQQPKI